MRNTHAYFLVVLLVSCLAGLGCSSSRAKKLAKTYWNTKPAAIATTGDTLHAAWLRLHYTGCGGFLMDYGGERLLLDPFFSNKSVPNTVLCRFQSDTALIDDFFTRRLGQPRDAAGTINTLLLSHAHHDHLADVPALLRNNLATEKIQVYGSRTVANLLRAFPGLLPDTARQLINLETWFTTLPASIDHPAKPPASPFFYTKNRRIRFAAVPSNHAGHYQFFMPHKLPFTKGHVDQPPARPPRFALNFKEGENFNFLIDLLDEQGAPVFRIFSNAGAACDAGVGFPPKALLEEKPVDLLLICGANYNIAKDYPIPLLEHTRPRILFVVHWENFFTPIPKLNRRPKTVPNTNMPKLMRALEDFSRQRGYPEWILLEEPLGRPVSIGF